MNQLNIMPLDDTLLNSIPNDLKLIIDVEIIRYEKQLCIDAHEKLNIKCPTLCHICRIGRGKININIDETHWLKTSRLISPGESTTHICCVGCIIHKKYMKCQICVQLVDFRCSTFNSQYGRYPLNNEELLETMNCLVTNSVENECIMCRSLISEKIKCIYCNEKCDDNFVKTIHHSIHGKKIIYFCKDSMCVLYGNTTHLDPSLTTFENLSDRNIVYKKKFIFHDAVH